MGAGEESCIGDDRLTKVDSAPVLPWVARFEAFPQGTVAIALDRSYGSQNAQQSVTLEIKLTLFVKDALRCYG
jgi:hypothetical protein